MIDDDKGVKTALDSTPEEALVSAAGAVKEGERAILILTSEHGVEGYSSFTAGMTRSQALLLLKVHEARLVGSWSGGERNGQAPNNPGIA